MAHETSLSPLAGFWGLTLTIFFDKFIFGGKCVKHKCPLLFRSYPIVLEFGVLILTLAYFVGFGIDDLTDHIEAAYGQLYDEMEKQRMLKQQQEQQQQPQQEQQNTNTGQGVVPAPGVEMRPRAAQEPDLQASPPAKGLDDGKDIWGAPFDP